MFNPILSITRLAVGPSLSHQHVLAVPSPLERGPTRGLDNLVGPVRSTLSLLFLGLFLRGASACNDAENIHPTSPACLATDDAGKNAGGEDCPPKNVEPPFDPCAGESACPEFPPAP